MNAVWYVVGITSRARKLHHRLSVVGDFRACSLHLRLENYKGITCNTSIKEVPASEIVNPIVSFVWLKSVLVSDMTRFVNQQASCCVLMLIFVIGMLIASTQTTSNVSTQGATTFSTNATPTFYSTLYAVQTNANGIWGFLYSTLTFCVTLTVFEFIFEG